MEEINYYDGVTTKDEKKEYKLNMKVVTADATYCYYNSIGNKKTLLELKEEKIKESKSMLAEYLEEHPLISDVTGKFEEYTCTMDKQNQLVQTLMIYNLSLNSNVDYTPMWNTRGGICEPWSIENLTALSFEMEQYVYPFIHYQQSIECLIRNVETLEELELIEIDYSKVGVINEGTDEKQYIVSYLWFYVFYN